MEGHPCDKLVLMLTLLLYVGCHSTVSKEPDKSCPTGLVSIPKNHPTFCIHPFEGFIASEGIVVSKMGQNPAINVSLEEAISYIDNDELVEVTPNNIRLRKRFLDPHERKRQARVAS